VPQTEAPPPIAFPGLTSSEVAERTADGRTNHTDDRSSRTVGDIVRSNVLTRFNAMVAVLAGTVLLLGDWRDALFAFVAVANAAIGIVQEWRAKATLDRLSLVSAPKVVVWRNGARSEISREDVVLDDVFELAPGDQVVVDGTVLRSDGLTVDESLLTGESEAVHKPVEVGVLSGSFVTAGGGVVRATAVGDDSYAQRLTRQAKQFRPRKSELARGIDQILRVVTWAIVPTAVILFVGQLLSTDSTIREDVIGSVAGVVALVPQGLVLLLSMAQAVAVIRLGRKNVLVQQLQAVETLARVTVLATDKTGTLTTGEVTLAEVELLDGEGFERTLATDALAALAAADNHPNATMIAIAAAFAQPPGWTARGAIPFDSSRKYSAVDFGPEGTWYVGAPEMLLADDHPSRVRVSVLASEGLRVLLLARGGSLPPAGALPDDLAPAALVTFSDDVRSDAAETIGYFLRENVVPKVISGDNPTTVSAIARRCLVPHADRAVDARELPTDPDELAAAAADNAVFGRVTPETKRSLLHALQAQGEVVAMTGDGVNDTLALKDADLGIAMGSGTPAAKSVSDLVLLDDRFSTLPSVVAEGRRVIANIERVARLFVTKNFWAAVLAVLTGLFTISYPILPRQLSVIDALTIGIPGFVLSFQANHDPVRPGFIPRVLRFSIPAGVVVGSCAMTVFALGGAPMISASRESAQSATTLTLCVLGLWVLFELARPLDRVRRALVATMVALGVGAFTIPAVADFFVLEVPAPDFAVVIAVVCAVGAGLISLALRLVNRYLGEERE
jgi:cation-transporting P-type ATPase E